MLSCSNKIRDKILKRTIRTSSPSLEGEEFINYKGHVSGGNNKSSGRPLTITLEESPEPRALWHTRCSDSWCDPTRRPLCRVSIPPLTLFPPPFLQLSFQNKCVKSPRGEKNKTKHWLMRPPLNSHCRKNHANYELCMKEGCTGAWGAVRAQGQQLWWSTTQIWLISVYHI